MNQRQLTAAIYARVSTDDQNCEMQLSDLRAYVARNGWAAAEYIEKMSSAKKRVVLNQLMDDARQKKIDIVVVWKLDRFGRSVQQLTRDIQSLDSCGVRFVALTQGIDTDKNNPVAKLMLHMLAAIAEFERGLIQERVLAGQQQYAADYEAGRIGKQRHSRSGRDLPMGRQIKIYPRDRALALRESGMTVREIAQNLGVSKSVIGRLLSPDQAALDLSQKSSSKPRKTLSK